MARYVMHIRSPKTADDSFAYMADLSNFAEWDPGVELVEQATGAGAGLGSAFDVTVKSIGGSLVLRYHTTEYDPPNRVVARASSKMLTSLDVITVRDDEAGSLVTYDAELTLNGPLGLADPILGLAFKRIGDKAAAGLIDALDGERVDEGSR